jgi:rod shape determining protein RodA
MGLGIWILLQPNLSNVVVLMVILGSLLWFNGIQLKHLAIFAFIGIFLIGTIVTLSTLGIRIPGLQEYQQQRIANFIVPDKNATFGATYNVSQALIAIGSGGLFGKGYGHGTQTQLRFLKVRHTDFIFAAMAEEFGFVGTALVVSLLVFVILRCFRTARRASDMFGALIAYGFGFLIFFQTAVNIGVNLQVIPVTGLTLPFISYGGSSLLSLALGIGLVESVILRHKPLEF